MTACQGGVSHPSATSAFTPFPLSPPHRQSRASAQWSALARRVSNKHCRAELALPTATSRQGNLTCSSATCCASLVRRAERSLLGRGRLIRKELHHFLISHRIRKALMEKLLSRFPREPYTGQTTMED